MKKMNLISIALVFTLIGCSGPILRTTHPPTPIDFSKPKIGAVYYLPKGLIPITISIEEASKKQGDSSGSSSSSNATNVTNTVNINNTNSQARPAKDDRKSNGVNREESTASDDKSELKKYFINTTIGDPKYVPDFRFPYFLEYKPSIGTEDAITIGVGPNQLLQTTTSKSNDQTGAFLGTLAQIAAEALKIAGAFAFDGSAKPKDAVPGKDCEPLQPMNLSTFIDPTPEGNSNFSQDYINSTSLKGTPLSINIKPLYSKNEMPMGYCNKISDEENSTCKRRSETGDKDTIGVIPDFNEQNIGVLFRSLMMYQITLTVDPLKNLENSKLGLWCVNPQSKTFSVMAPNDGHIFAVDVSRTPLVEKKTNLTIVNGMLTQIDVNKPSTLLAGAKIPLDILKAIASVPNEILTLRIKRIQDEGSLTKAQGDLLLNEIQRLKNENLLRQQQSSAAIN